MKPSLVATEHHAGRHPDWHHHQLGCRDVHEAAAAAVGSPGELLQLRHREKLQLACCSHCCPRGVARADACACVVRFHGRHDRRQPPQEGHLHLCALATAGGAPFHVLQSGSKLKRCAQILCRVRFKRVHHRVVGASGRMAPCCYASHLLTVTGIAPRLLRVVTPGCEDGRLARVQHACAHTCIHQARASVSP